MPPAEAAGPTAGAEDAPAGSAVPEPVAHLSVEQRVANGKAARAAVPRSSHALWAPPGSRPDALEVLSAQEATRVGDLVAIRHQRMSESPFAFYRGAAAVMVSDLARTPVSGLTVQCCGDAHLLNFGGFQSPERRLVFDVNDFDETSAGPFEWDVKRLAASFEIAARSQELSAKTARAVVLRCVRAYREAMAGFAAMSNLQVWYARLDVEAILGRWQGQVSAEEAKRFDQMTAKAYAKDSTKALAKLARNVDGEIRIVSNPPLVVPLDELTHEAGSGAGADEVRAWLGEGFRAYRRSLQPDRRRLLEGYRIVDFARKVVGVGSVGTRCWIALLVGKDDADPLFLQIKEAEASVLEPYTGRSVYANHGRRVVEGQRLLQAGSDVLLGWTRAPGFDGVESDYYTRQLWDGKVSANIETMTPEIMNVYGEMCGWTLAHGHARSGDRVAIAAYLGSADVFDRAVGDFAASYADQNHRDFEHATQQWSYVPAEPKSG